MSNRPIEFIDSNTDLATTVQGTFDPTLVSLSFVIASLASYAALLMAERFFATKAQPVRYAWLAAGSFAMGTGIWAMHFIGMLAFKLPLPVNYDLSLTGLSILPAILASCAALHYINTSEMSIWRLTLGGLLMASGIGAMHLTGMTAMIMDIEVRFDPVLLVASIALSHLLATAALYSKFALSKHLSLTGGQLNFISAVIMGSSICIMHYTAMAAALYFPVGEPSVQKVVLSSEALALATTLAAGLILGTSILMAILDRRLQEANSQVNLILNSVGEGIFGINFEGITTFLNPAAAKMLGWEKVKIIGNSHHVVFHHTRIRGAPYPQKECPISATIRNGEAHYVRDEIFWRKNGSSFPVEYSSTPIHSSKGNIKGAVVVFRDLTERRNLEFQLLRSQKLESIGQLAAGMAHEINTPTQFVSDNLRFLKQSFEAIHKVLAVYGQVVQTMPRDAIDPQLFHTMEGTLAEADLAYITEEIPKAIQQSLDGVDRVGNIVGAMKVFSHPGTAEKKLIDLNHAIESTVMIARNEWKYVADVTLHLDPTLPPIPCFPGELNQVLLNLLVNAAHAIEAVVGKAGETKGTITISTHMQEDWVEIRIADTGTGIPENIQHRIFDPFFTTKDVGKGTGQGLAMAHDEIVQKHGGRLTFETAIGQGSTFIIQLPSRPEHQVKELEETTHLVCG